MKFIIKDDEYITNLKLISNYEYLYPIPNYKSISPLHTPTSVAARTRFVRDFVFSFLSRLPSPPTVFSSFCEPLPHWRLLIVSLRAAFDWLHAAC